ncbi:GDT1-like protein 1, chloroplastic [Nymphaea colorata]|nr:GDT1-like protein 1, chloroplastic [Nymphaea colorata]
MRGHVICGSGLGVALLNPRPSSRPPGFQISAGHRREWRQLSGNSNILRSMRSSREFRLLAYLKEQELQISKGGRLNRQETAENLQHQCHANILDQSSILNNLMKFLPENLACKTFRDCNLSITFIVKVATLFGLLTFCGSQGAQANTEFASTLQSSDFLGDIGDISTGFASAFLLIFFSELGDKTFFIAALLASRNPGAVVFAGTFGALAAMTVISVFLGRAFHYIDGILPFRFGEADLPIDDIAAVCLLVYFGVSTLLETASDDGLKSKDEEEEAKLAISEVSGNGAGILSIAGTVISTFALVFVAEWGDKSFFSTIALAAASSPIGVIGGSLAGHAVATLIAVLGGSLLGTFFSEKVIAYIGGTLFLVFAVVTLVEIFT